MSNNNLPRKPVRMVPQNEELLKSQEGIAGQRKGATDFSEDVPYAQISTPTATYRTPLDRVSGNEFFRRYIDGRLDIEYATQKVLDAIHRAKDSGGVSGQLNNEEKTALSIMFPAQFDFVDSAMVATVAAVQMKLSPVELELVRRKVAARLAEIMNYNAGMGGGSVPGRSGSRS